jgi:hypothetical protein
VVVGAGGVAVLVGVLVGVLGTDVEAAVGVVADEVLGVELLLLPHPARSAPESSETANSGDRLPIIGPP